mgnify:CR=1 FL=1
MNEDKIITKLLELDERVERMEQNMVTKSDNQRVLDTLEGIVTICKRIEEDHLFAIEWIKRLQTQVDHQESEIQKIKTRLQIA